MTPNPTILELLVDLFRISHRMIMLKMILETLSTQKPFVAGFAVRFLTITFPRFKVPMLTALMTFPIILTAKCLGTVIEGTTIRLLMALHVLSVISLVND